MITTPDLIDSLAASAEPIRRLRPPLVRVALWLLLSVFVLALLAIGHGMRPDLIERLQNFSYVTTVGGSLLTGVLAAISAFQISIPGRSRFWYLLPIPALLLWSSTIGYGCLTNWIDIRPDGIRPGEAVQCFATLVLTSVPLSLTMLVMLRHASLFRPTSVAIMGSLAVAAITASALSLFHVLDATLMVLMWNLGTLTLIVGLGGTLGRRMLSWFAPLPIFGRY